MTQYARRTNETHGYINFPIDDEDYEDSGEGGLSVYAVWTEHNNEVCIPGSGALVAGNVVFWPNEHLVENPGQEAWDNQIRERGGNPEEAHFTLPEVTRNRMDLWVDWTRHVDEGTREPPDDYRPFYIDTLSVKGFVYLGSTGASLTDPDPEGGHYFEATIDDVTSEGQELLERLSELYGSDPTLITFLDT